MPSKQLKANLIKSYNSQAEQRDKKEMDAWKAAERAHFLSFLREDNKQTLLELGAGHGRDSLFFKSQGLRVTCIDLSPKMVELCQQKGLDAQVMDMVHLDFEPNSFDAIYALNSFLHLPKDEFSKALEYVCKILHPDGLFYLGLYGGIDFAGPWENDTYIPKRFFSFYSDENIKNILSETFEILYFKLIEFEAGQLSFQSAILRKRLETKK